MGTPVSIITGNTCPSCTPGQWVEGWTPRYMRISFSGIEPCFGTPPDDPIPNRTFLAKQTDVCLWEFGSDEFAGYWWPRGVETVFFCHEEPPPPEHFWFQGGGGCDLGADNTLNCDTGADYHNGSARAHESGGPSWEFSQTYNMCPELPLMFEEWEIDADNLMYRIADGTGRVNILFTYYVKN